MRKVLLLVGLGGLGLLAGVAAAQGVPAEAVEVPEASDEAMRYYWSGNVVWIVRALWALVIPALFLFTGFSARVRDWATAIGRWWWFIIAAYFVMYAGINFVIDLPLDWYTGFVRQHDYGLSNQTLGKWLGNGFKGLLVSMVGGVMLVWIPYLLLTKSPRRWWLYTTLAFVPVILFVMLIVPVWVDPLFNDFGPMQDRELEAKILAIADRAGIEDGRVYEVNKSVDTNAVNAYVTGFMGTKRIVLWDTIIEKLDEDELLFVMGHEMGHYALHHVLIGVLLAPLGLGATLLMIHLTARGLIRRFHHRFGFDELADIASLPLLILLANLFSLVTMPVANGVSRYMEHEADRFGLEITRDNHGGAMAFVSLQQENLGNPRPGPIYTLWRASHPVLGERIDFCNDYRPWETGEPLRFDHLFEDPE